jgi:hypothetical protein
MAGLGCAVMVCAVVAATLAVPSATPGLADAAGYSDRPRGAVADCSTQSGANFPGAFTSPRNLVVGPLALIGAGGSPTFADSFGGQKFPALVRVGHRITVELSRRTRKGAGLAYGPLPQGHVRLRDAHRVVTFVARDILVRRSSRPLAPVRAPY